MTGFETRVRGAMETIRNFELTDESVEEWEEML